MFKVSSDPKIPNRPAEKIDQIGNDFLQTGVHSTTQESHDLISHTETFNPYISRTTCHTGSENVS